MTNEERDDAIKSISKGVSDMQGNMKVFVDKCKEHHKTLYGNGRPGLLERHNAVEEQQRQCPALQRSLLPNVAASRSNWIQIGVLIIAILAVVIATIR